MPLPIVATQPLPCKSAIYAFEIEAFSKTNSNILHAELFQLHGPLTAIGRISVAGGAFQRALVWDHVVIKSPDNVLIALT